MFVREVKELQLSKVPLGGWCEIVFSVAFPSYALATWVGLEFGSLCSFLGLRERINGRRCVQVCCH